LNRFSGLAKRLKQSGNQKIGSLFTGLRPRE